MSSNLSDLIDKVAIVTGAGRGIGKAIALGLAEAGAAVVVAARTAQDIEKTASEIKRQGGKSLAIPTDVRLSEQVNNLIDGTVKEFNRVDILVNNAGGSFNVATMKMSEGGWDAIIRENLKSVFLCSQSAARVMIQQKRGAIVNIASVAGIDAYVFNAAYGAAKAGIMHLTKTMAVDLARHNIRVNAIAPGYIATEGMLQLFGAHPEAVKQIPLARLGRPEDIVGGVIYLASDASLYVTGETLVIDGGLTIKPSLSV
ncbi:MAG TPA: SDR family oxidoreductase [Dehalococcoidia bacterium]|nr:SDR family oxidoreductase [Dehalococcoidia bacterium]